jgi:hypothetical protein
MGQSISFKPWKASKALKVTALVFAFAGLAALVLFCVSTWHRPLSLIFYSWRPELAATC